MIKGHVCIDLHNHKSGFTERIEGDNIITSAFQNLLNRYVVANNPASEFCPLATKMFGGIYLLDKTLDNDIYMPGDSKLIGCGYQGQNTDTYMIGSYNNVESGRTGNDYVHVWDYSTSQANGEIKSLALVNVEAGRFPFYEMSFLSHETNLGGRKIIHYDEVNEYVYLIAGYDGKLYRTKLSCLNLDIFMTANGTNELEDTGKVLDGFKQRGIYTDILYGYEGYVYRVVGSGSTVSLFSIKVSDLSFDESSAAKSFLLPDGLGAVYCSVNELHNTICIYASNNNAYIFDFTTGNLLKEIVVGTVSNGALSTTPNGDYYLSTYNNGSKCYRINTNGDLQELVNIATPPTNISRAPLMLTKSGLFISNDTRAYVGFYTKCLMTNYNLPSIIEKTVAQSMKVTYTLTQQ